MFCENWLFLFATIVTAKQFTGTLAINKYVSILFWYFCHTVIRDKSNAIILASGITSIQESKWKMLHGFIFVSYWGNQLCTLDLNTALYLCLKCYPQANMNIFWFFLTTKIFEINKYALLNLALNLNFFCFEF